MRAHLAPSPLDRVRRLTARFAPNQSGVAAIEFAAVLPFLLVAYIGTVEFAQGVILSRKISVAVRNLADMTSQEQAAISNARIEAIARAARSAVSPYDPSRATMTVTSLQMQPNGSVVVVWSDRFTGSGARTLGHPTGAPPHTVPAGLLTPGQSTIMAEVDYDYEPVMNFLFKTNLKLTGSGSDSGAVYMRPRSLASITRTT